MLDADAEVRRLAMDVLDATSLKAEAALYRAIEENIARKLHALLRARESGVRIHLSKAKLLPLAHVCPSRRMLRAVVLLEWRSQQCRQSVETMLDADEKSRAKR